MNVEFVTSDLENHTVDMPLDVVEIFISYPLPFKLINLTFGVEFRNYVGVLVHEQYDPYYAIEAITTLSCY